MNYVPNYLKNAKPLLKPSKDLKVPKSPTKESELQALTNALLALKQIEYTRYDDSLYRLMGPFSKMPIHVKKVLKNTIAGKPDNDCKIPLNEHFYLGCNIELKVGKGKQHGKQKIYAKRLPVNVLRTEEEVKDMLDQFEGMVDKLKKYLEGNNNA